MREFLLEHCLAGESGEALRDDTPLLAGGILDSLSTLKLVLHLEEKFGIGFSAHEIDPQNFGSIGAIVAAVRAKQA